MKHKPIKYARLINTNFLLCIVDYNIFSKITKDVHPLSLSYDYDHDPWIAPKDTRSILYIFISYVTVISLLEIYKDTNSDII